MIDKIKEKAKALLTSEAVKVVIGYGKGTEDDTPRAIFVRKPADVDQFIYDEKCVQNLGVYLVKSDVKKLGKACVIANLFALKSMLQIASENQLKEEESTALAVSDKDPVELNGFKAIEDYVAAKEADIPEDDKKTIEKLETMSAEERWQFWTGKLSKCIKCYACRAACPMCYCPRCVVEYNQPQMLIPESTPLGNFEWHMTRAMHLAGRCVNCGECGRACPENIPIHLLTYKTVQITKSNFGQDAGLKAEFKPLLCSFEEDDKEDFIQ